MLSCLTVLGRAASAFHNGDGAEGRRMLGAIAACPFRETCSARPVCTTAARGITQTLRAEMKRLSAMPPVVDKPTVPVLPAE